MSSIIDPPLRRERFEVPKPERAPLERRAQVALLAFILSLLTVSSWAGTPPPNNSAFSSTILSFHPIAYWRLNETNPPPAQLTAVNLGSCGAAANGAYVGGTPGIGGALMGDANSAARFNGSISVPFTPCLGQYMPFTVEAWLKASGTTTGTPCPLSYGTFGTNRSGWLIYQNGTSGWNLRMYNGIGANTSVSIMAGGATVPGVWYHVAAVYDGTSATLYVNGVGTTAVNSTPFNPNTSGPLTIGMRSDGAFSWAGSADEVAIYPGVVSPSEVLSHYQAGTNASPLVPYVQLVQSRYPTLYLRLDEPALPRCRNSGSLGAAADGTYEPGSSPGAPGVPLSGANADHYACQFNSGFGYIDVPGVNLDLTGPVTVVAWAKANPANGIFQTIVGKGDTSYRLDIDWNGYPRFADGQANPDVIGPNRIDDGQWHFVGGVYDGAGSNSLYVDGLPAASAGAPSTVPGNVGDVWMGGAPDYGNARLFNGVVDEVAIFPYALAPQQFQQAFAAAFSSGPPANNYYQVQLQPGWNVIANQLSRGSNTLGEVLPSVPSFSIFYHRNLNPPGYSVSIFDADLGGWDAPNLLLSPGEGGFIYNPTPSPFTVTLIGETITPQLPANLPCQGPALVARQIPAPATYEEITGLPPAEGTKLYRYDSALQGDPWDLTNWIAYSFSQGVWTPATPAAGIGEPVFIQTPAVAPAPTNHEPIVATIPDQVIHAGAVLRITVSATDSDAPTNRLTYSLGAGAPAGATIDPQSGLFYWTPDLTASGTSLTITVRVTDDGTPPLTTTQTFLVTIVSPMYLRIEPHGTSVELSWNSIPGQLYLVEATSDLTAPVWPVRTVVAATDWTVHWADVINGAADLWCYRVTTGWHESCQLSKDWKFISSSINAWPQGIYRKPPCEPMALNAYAVDRHVLTYQCGCDQSTAQKNVPMRSEVQYDWSIVSGGGRFVRVTGGAGGAFESVEQVLYQPPDLALNQEVTVNIIVKALHGDLGKPPFHGPSSAKITMKIRHELTAETQTVGDVQIERQKDEYVYDLTVDPSNVFGSPLPAEQPVGDCLPSHAWGQVSPITGGILVQNKNLYTDDSVVLLSWMASDRDKLKLKCTHAGRCISTEEELPLRDVLDFEWSCDKGSFPVGNLGDSVVWRAPDTEGDVTITLTIRDVSGQYDDDDLVVTNMLHVQKIERKARVAAVAWIDASDPAVANLPQPADIPPPANADWLVPWIAPDYLGSNYGYSYYEHPTLGGGKQWQQLRLLPGSTDYERLGSFHPWYHACVGLKDSANPRPPESFDGLAGLRAWTQNKEYRSVLAMKVKARVRRGHMVSADLDDNLLETGWTPMRGYPNIVERFFIGILAPELANLLASIQANPFEPGERKDAKITISSLCQDRVTFRMSQSFRLGATGNRINKAMTNRDAPWINPAIEITLYADREPQQSDFQHTADPLFPTWDLYYGDPTLNRFTTKSPGERQIEFINRGPKINPRGL